MNKIKTLIICIVLLLSSISILLLNYDNNHTIIENKVLYTLNNSVDMISMMLETYQDSGMYEESLDIEWPNASKYVFNSELSSCENGGTLSWNYTTNTLELTNNVSDRCYIYFDISADVTVYINGTFSTTSPASLECSNGTASYSNQYKTVSVSTLDYTKCTLTYESPSTITYLNDYIISLSGTTQGNGEVVSENGYRFEGKNPNNYIWFNNELWRIIGVFDEDSHGVSGEYLVKIIKATSIGDIVFDIDAGNDWSTSSLNKLLNNYYYYGIDGDDSGYCYGYINIVPTSCRYDVYGIKDEYRQMIEEVTWYLGGYSTQATTSNTFYAYERSSNVYGTNATTFTGYVGLMYISDYGYSALASSCSRSTNLNGYNIASCAGSSWLYTGNSNYTWSMTQYTTGSNVFYISFDGRITMGSETYYSRVIRPTLYLSSSVYLIDGDGTVDSPYIIGMSERN